MCTRRTQELRSLPTTPASSSCLHNALASGCHEGPLGLSPAPRQLGLLRVARPRPDVDGGSEGTARWLCDPCRELQARSLPRQPRHIPTRAHTHPAHSPATSSPPPPRARPGRRERESKGGCRLESAGSAPMKVGSAAAGWEGRKGRRRRRRQAVAHMQWMSGGACADRTPSSPKSHTHTPVPRAGFLTIPHTGVYRIESFRIPQ